MDTQISESKHTLRRSRTHAWKNLGKCTEQLAMISSPSTSWMLSVPTSALTWRMISAITGAPQRWCEDQASLTYDEQVQLYLPKQFRTTQKILSEYTAYSAERHRDWQSLNAIERGSHHKASWVTVDKTNKRWSLRSSSKQDHDRRTPNWDRITGLPGAVYPRHRLGCLPNGLPKWMLKDRTGRL